MLDNTCNEQPFSKEVVEAFRDSIVNNNWWDQPLRVRDLTVEEFKDLLREVIMEKEIASINGEEYKRLTGEFDKVLRNKRR